jgi:hypothetical protein
MSGFGGRLKIGKGSKGFGAIHWRESGIPPGLELNDLAILKTTDLSNRKILSLLRKPPVSIFRNTP